MAQDSLTLQAIENVYDKTYISKIEVDFESI